MPGRNRLTGICWHEEWHTVDPKKEKAADCIYLGKDRICHKRGCERHDEKCFDATVCKYRVRSDEEVPVEELQRTSNKPQYKQRLSEGIIGIDCTMPIGCSVYSNIFGSGVYHSFDKANRLISVKFDIGLKRFQYPEAIFNKHIIVGQELFAYVIADSKNAERK